MDSSTTSIQSDFTIENISRNILPKYNLHDCIVSMVKFKDTDKQRAVYKVESSEGCFCLKKVYFGKGDLLYVYSAIEWLYRNGINTPKLMPTAIKGRYVEYNNMLFILTPWIDGIKCDFDNELHRNTSLKKLAAIHNCTRTFTPIVGSVNREGFDDYYISIYKHFNQLLETYNKSYDLNDKFSLEFREHFDKNLFLARTAVEIASNINCNELNRSLCHGDYVNKNIIFSSDNELWIIDFDKCKFDYSAHDISYFLRRLLKRESTTYDVDMTIKLLKAYNSESKLSPSDLRYVLSYILFPQKYWKISRDYYKNYKKCNKISFLTLIKKSCTRIDKHLKFCEEIIPRVEESFDVEIY